MKVQELFILVIEFKDFVSTVQSIEDEVSVLGGCSDGYVVYANDAGIDSGNLLDDEAQKKMPVTKGKVAKWLYQLYNIKNA